MESMHLIKADINDGIYEFFYSMRSSMCIYCVHNGFRWVEKLNQPKNNWLWKRSAVNEVALPALSSSQIFAANFLSIIYDYERSNPDQSPNL